MKQKLTSCILCFCVLISVAFSSNIVSAKTIEEGNIIIDTVAGLSGDTVIVNIRTENNPGIMAMTLSINYDSSVLTYDKYYQGFLWDYMVVAHPDKNIIRFVNCESYNRKENDTMISLQFKINEDAKTDFYPISITYNAGDFCNWWLDKVMPTITSGGVDVTFNTAKCKHKEYGKWTTVAEPGCSEPGAKQHVCTRCGHIEIADIPATGHDYSDEWVVDKPATETESGTMSRHCKKCGDKIDILTFSLEQSQKENIENIPGTPLQSSEFTEQLLKEQHPEKEEAQQQPQENTINSVIDNIFNNSSDNNSGNTVDKSYLNRIKEYLFTKNGTGLVGKISNAIPKSKIFKILVISSAVTFYKIFSII